MIIQQLYKKSATSFQILLDSTSLGLCDFDEVNSFLIHICILKDEFSQYVHLTLLSVLCHEKYYIQIQIYVNRMTNSFQLRCARFYGSICVCALRIKTKIIYDTRIHISISSIIKNSTYRVIWSKLSFQGLYT